MIKLEKIHKRYILVAMVMVMVFVVIYKLSTSYAYNINNNGNIVPGEDWSINIIDVSNVEAINEALLVNDVETLGNTLNFEVNLPKITSSVSFDFTVQNMGKLDAELYALSLTGLTELQKEYISYEIIPLDYITLKTSEVEGSVLKKDEKHVFRVTLNYQANVTENNLSTNNLNLGLTVIYRQK